jgi:hypothetical protein
MAANHAKYVDDPKYMDTVKQAVERGFKPAPLWMCQAWPAYQDVIYKWRGGCWLKQDYVIQE